MADKIGCHVTAFSTTRARDDLTKKLGAEHIVDTNDVEAMKKNSQKFDVVLCTAVISESS